MSTLKIIKSIGAGVQKNESFDLAPSTYRGGINEMFFWGNNGEEYKFCYTGHLSSLKAYQQCPPLSAIINRKAQAHINGKTWIMTSSGKGKGKESFTEPAKKIRKLFAKPNPLQSWKQFKAQRKIYVQLFGYCIVLPIIPAGYEKYGAIEATSFWNIPPYMVDIEESNKLFYQTDFNGIVNHIKLNYRGEKINLPLDKICIFKDFTPSFNTMIFPDSRVESLRMPINNIIAAYDSQNEVISYAGSQGIISPEAHDVAGPLFLKEDDKNKLQNDFRMQYGIRKGQFRYIISPAAIKWQAMGTDPRKLMLTETITEGAKAICDGYGYPPHLLGLIDVNYDNQASAQKDFYQNTVIPESESEDEEWNNFLKTADYNLNIETDFSHLPIMQEDKGEQATARKTLGEALIQEFNNNFITLNRVLELLGEDTIGSEGDKYKKDLAAPVMTLTNTDEDDDEQQQANAG